MAAITGPVDGEGNVKVNTPLVKADAGYLVPVSENHDGLVGEAALRRPLRVSTDGRLRIGFDSLHWQDTFNHAVLDAGAYQAVTSTMTLTVAGGALNFNAGSSVASAAVARVQTYRNFLLNGSSSLEIQFRMALNIMPQANNVAQLGIGFATGVAEPTDGIYFELNGSGILQGVVNINGSTVAVDLTGGGAGDAPFEIQNLEYMNMRIIADQDRAEFWIDGNLYGVINSPPAAPTISQARALPLLMRLYNSGVVSTAQIMKVADIVVACRDLAQNRLFPTQQAGMGMSAVNAARGAASGQTANYANSAAPASATLSNTAAGYTTLGGQFQFAAVAGAETDYALFAFQVPAAGPALGNKNLVIRGIRVETFNMGAAVATTPHLLQWALGVGATAASLATADSLTAGTRAARRIALGVQSLPVAAAIGAAATPIDVNLDAPLYVEAGTWVHVILKMPVATATVSQIIRGIVSLNAYWE